MRSKQAAENTEKTVNRVLTEENYQEGIRYLSEKDSDLGNIVVQFGIPPLWKREPGFSTLLQIILEQQVSLESAKAVFNRLNKAVSPLRPGRFLELDDSELLSIGFSRQKTGYSRILARAIVDKNFDLNDIEKLDDSSAREELMRLKGIGRWTADIYLLMALGRQDIMPVGDLALETALRNIKYLESRPDPEELKRISSIWKPWRAVAARMLWHYYLSVQAQSRGNGQKKIP